MASSPKAPDPYAQTAAQQGAESYALRTGAVVNNPNLVNPYGSQTTKISGYEMIPNAQGQMVATPRYTQTTMLSPDQMRLLGYETAMKGNLGRAGTAQSEKLGKMASTNLDTRGLPDWVGYTPQAGLRTDAGLRRDEGPTDRASIENAMLSRYREQSGKQRSAEDAQLAARGLMPGSDAFSTVADTRSRADTDAFDQAYLASGQESRQAQAAYNQAAQQAYTNYNQAAQQEYANRQEYANATNQLRQNELQERTFLRELPLQEISAFLGGSQPTIPQFTPFARQGVNAAPIGQYIGQNYQNELASSNAFNQGLFGLLGGLAGGIGQAGGFSKYF